MDALCKSYLQMLDPNYNQDLKLCLGTFRVYVDAYEPSLVLDVQHFLQYTSKIKSLPKYPTHDAVFVSKYIIKLFEARPNAVRIFVLRIKQFITASNIDLSDILEIFHILFYHLGVSNNRRLYWIWCIWLHIFISGFSWKYETGAMTTYCLYRWSTRWQLCASATVFPFNNVISMWVFTAESWAIIKALEEIKNYVASKC